MFESFARGFRMIWASIKMGWRDKRLLVPSILTVFTNIFFGSLLLVGGSARIGAHPLSVMPGSLGTHMNMARTVSHVGMPTFGMLQTSGNYTNSGASSGGSAFMEKILHNTQVNGPGDPSGVEAMDGIGQLITGDNAIWLATLTLTWWLTNRFLEGVTTALVYSHLTLGKGTGRFIDAAKAVLCSLPAIVVLGIVTFIARRLATFMQNKRSTGVLGMSLGFVSSIIEVFWTLAGHLILPAIVIEGCSFWGGLKRADRIAQGNLLTIGIGEVGVEGICKVFTMLLYGVGMAGLAGGVYAHLQMGVQFNMASVGALSVLWIVAVVVATSMSIYIRSAFYTCLYVWAIESEAVEATERSTVRPPEPLALALA